MPPDTIKCINSWKNKMPEYELVLWDKNRFDITSVPFVKEAYQVKQWAAAADYIRIYALYTEGGIYMDTDVYVLKKFDDLLQNCFFTSLEYHADKAKKENANELLNEDGTKKSDGEIFTRGIGIQAAVLGSVNGHPFLKSCLDWFKDKHFILPDGTYSNRTIIAPAIYADIAVKYGFRYKDELQKLKDDMTIYPSFVFAGDLNEANDDSYAIHFHKGSWHDKKKMLFFARVKEKLSKNNFLRRLLGKKEIKLHIDLGIE